MFSITLATILFLHFICNTIVFDFSFLVFPSRIRVPFFLGNDFPLIEAIEFVDLFEKEEKWRDWSTVFRAGPEVFWGIQAAECSEVVMLENFNEQRQVASR